MSVWGELTQRCVYEIKIDLTSLDFYIQKLSLPRDVFEPHHHPKSCICECWLSPHPSFEPTPLSLTSHPEVWPLWQQSPGVIHLVSDLIESLRAHRGISSPEQVLQLSFSEGHG